MPFNMADLHSVIGLSPGAVFRRADLHVHTPGSQDFKAEDRGLTPNDLVRAALDKGLEIIAVTDHNTIAWCDPMRDAAAGTSLNVFPGVEVSTKHGHLLAIFDLDTPVEGLEEFLIRAGFTKAAFGDLDKASTEDMDTLAQWVEEVGGVAIAAHVDGPRGLMKFAVAAERRRIASSKCIRAFEVLDPEKRDLFQEGRDPGLQRRVACIMASDCHERDLIGARSTYLKMDEVSVYGLKQAFNDPGMRIRLQCDPMVGPDSAIEALWVTSGFLSDQRLRFSDSLTCLIGGTGVGKSLAVELIRFALVQQARIHKISSEVRSLLRSCLGDPGKVSVLIRRRESRYLVERTISTDMEYEPAVHRVGDSGLEELEGIDVASFFPIKAYSQSEVIEFAREPEARLSLTDDLIEISVELSEISRSKGQLRGNAQQVRDVSRRLDEARLVVKELPGVREQIARLTKVLNHPRIVGHRRWLVERQALGTMRERLSELRAAVAEDFPTVKQPLLPPAKSDSPNPDLMKRAQESGDRLVGQLEEIRRLLLDKGIDGTLAELTAIRREWDQRFTKEQAEYNVLLESIDTENVGYQSLSKKLTQLLDREAQLTGIEEKIAQELLPRLYQLNEAREQWLTALQRLRRQITERRKRKAAELTAKLDRRVVIDVSADANGAKLKDALDSIKVGSYVADSDLKVMADSLHPVPFVKSMLAGDFDTLASQSGLDRVKFERLGENVRERNLLAELYELQLVDVDDVVKIRFQVQGGAYRDLENLAHGQKCTVVLSVAMAEGNFPLIVDQPEDALHAPYIEDNIVSTLRRDRGSRQCIFATRNANVLVSGDAEQVIIMDGDADRGWVQRSGSIDRFSTRDLVLLHLEGGIDAFQRKQAKYGLSL